MIVSPARYFTRRALWATSAALVLMLSRASVSGDLNLLAGSSTVYELNVAVANAAHPRDGSPEQLAATAAKISPNVRYRGEPEDWRRCQFNLSHLQEIKLGTLEDLVAPSTDYHAGITLQYIKDKVKANIVWLQPIFPSNDRWNLPDAEDNLGSPYAVRDMFHVKGSLSRPCIEAGKDEYSLAEGGTATPCWGNASIKTLVAEADRLGLKLMLDIPFNHFGHNYLFYDYMGTNPIRDWVSSGQDLNHLWDFAATHDESLVNPEVIDTPEKLEKVLASNAGVRADYDNLVKICQEQGKTLVGDEQVRAFNMWRTMLDSERQAFVANKRCNAPLFLEQWVPGFYLGANGEPSTGVGDNFTNNWKDVKFLYWRKDPRHAWEHVRNREYAFRIINYWIAQGFHGGFRLDHTTDGDSGLSPDDWKYILWKANYYDWVRKGRPAVHERPIYLAEEFHDQMGMAPVVDVMTEGYVGDMRGQNGQIKNASFVEAQLEKDARFGDSAYVMRALETHDEPRLQQNTGFNDWTGAGFWGIGATSRGMTMLLMGQEFGESWGVGFRRSDYLRSRFVGDANHRPYGQELVDFYGRMIEARRDWQNRALIAKNRYFLRTKTGNDVDQRIFAQAKWDTSQGVNVIFTFHNLWEENVAQSYYIPPDLAANLSIQDGLRYRLIDLLDGAKQYGDCHSGAELKWEIHVEMESWRRARWLKLELCQ